MSGWWEACCAISLIVLLVYAGLLALTYWQFNHAPTGFIPQQDKGYLVLNVQLPDSASVERTQRIMAQDRGPGPRYAGRRRYGGHFRPVADRRRQRAEPGLDVRHARRLSPAPRRDR